MKELLQNLECIEVSQAQGYTLIDTCYLIHIFEHHEKIKQFKEQLQEGKYAITSFNIEELMHVEHKLNKKIKEEIRKFLKEKEEIDIITIDVHPGDRASEEEYVRSINPELIHIMHEDISDGVLFATAIQIGADIITRDKHHLYNQIAEKFANEHNIDIRNKI